MLKLSLQTPLRGVAVILTTARPSQIVFQPARSCYWEARKKYPDRFQLMFGRHHYNSHHLDDTVDEFTGKVSQLAPALWRASCEMPSSSLVETGTSQAKNIRLSPYRMGKVTVMSMSDYQLTLPLSNHNRSLLPPKADTSIVMVNVARQFRKYYSTSAVRQRVSSENSHYSSTRDSSTVMYNANNKFESVSSDVEDSPVPLRPLKGKSDKNPVRHFVDCVDVIVEAGKGGDGKINFSHVFAVEFAGPDGGDGGHGAHVIFRASDRVRDLSHVKRRVEAIYGGPGLKKNMSGKDASHLFVDVPTGTLLRNGEGELVGDLDEEGAYFIAARGGAGGKGNAHFKTAVRQAPEIAESGAEGEKFNYTLELRTMADVGLIGFPNAGKSTLLTAISRARPKVASYPFTTLNPHIGMVQYSDITQLAVADLPGLLPGAHRNHGLGIDFLRHVQRCSVLLFVLDMEQEEPWEQLEQLKYELEMYQPGLSSRPAAVLANKMDLEESEDKMERLLEEVGAKMEVIPVSGRTGINLAIMLTKIKKLHDQF